MSTIRVAVVGIGNCTSSLIQGINYYRDKKPGQTIGLMHWEIGSYNPSDIEIVLAFDIDKRKVNKDVNEAIFERPNCTTVFFKDVPKSGVIVKMGKILDGFPDHMKHYDEKYAIVVADSLEPTEQEVTNLLKDSGADILINYLPVGSEKATRFYAQCALNADVAFVNNIPVFIASDLYWAKLFEEKNLPLIGDDIKSQLGATIVHRILTDLFRKRGVKLERTYQLNTGGNTDFLNMLNQHRLSSKTRSKTEAVKFVAGAGLDDENIHIGPSEWVPWQKDNKVCFLRMEGKLFGDITMNLELRLSVEDSPNSAGVVIDAIRCAKLALDRGWGGVLHAPSAYFYKHPPKQYTDDLAYRMLESFIKENKTCNETI